MTENIGGKIVTCEDDEKDEIAEMFGDDNEKRMKTSWG